MKQRDGAGGAKVKYMQTDEHSLWRHEYLGDSSKIVKFKVQIGFQNINKTDF